MKAAALALAIVIAGCGQAAQANHHEPAHPWFRHRIAQLKAQRDDARAQHRADVGHLVNVRNLAFDWYTQDTMTGGAGVLTYRAAAATVLDRMNGDHR